MAYRIAVVKRINNKTVISQSRRLSSYFQPSESEYTKEPVYPPIIDLSYQAVRERKVENVAQKITSLPTVEEKLIELNEPRYYGWWACQLKESLVPYNSLEFGQYATRTCLLDELPPAYSALESKAVDNLPLLKERLSEILAQEFEYVSKRLKQDGEKRSVLTEENRLTRNIVPLLNRLIVSVLSPSNQNLEDTEVDWSPRLEAFWSLGGIEPDRLTKKGREGLKNSGGKIELDEPVDRPMQYRGTPVVTLRHEKPLPQFLDRNSGLSVDGSIPSWKLDPRVLGFKLKHSRATNIPGFWPGTKKQHGFLSILQRGHLALRDSKIGTSDHQEALDFQAIIHSFAWTLSQACFLGFGPYTELTYPITTQTIITNGQYFSFYAYQMNTCALYGKHAGPTNPYRNVCFKTKETKLFDVIENGQVKGFNDDVLKNLIKFYLMEPVEPQMELRPYLSPELYIAEVSDIERRQNVEKMFKDLYSNRPDHRLKEEIYHWEKIYKIDHKTRPFDAKRRFFETKSAWPETRRLNDRPPKYIPRALRNPPKKSRRGRIPVQASIKL